MHRVLTREYQTVIFLLFSFSRWTNLPHPKFYVCSILCFPCTQYKFSTNYLPLMLLAHCNCFKGMCHAIRAGCLLMEQLGHMHHTIDLKLQILVIVYSSVSSIVLRHSIYMYTCKHMLVLLLRLQRVPYYHLCWCTFSTAEWKELDSWYPWTYDPVGALTHQLPMHPLCSSAISDDNSQSFAVCSERWSTWPSSRNSLHHKNSHEHLSMHAFDNAYSCALHRYIACAITSCTHFDYIFLWCLV